MLKRLATTLLLTSLLFVNGCSTIPEGAGRWPHIHVGPPVAFTPEEQAVLAQFAKDHPEVAKKVIGRNNELAAAVDKYNEKARTVNREILKTVGFTDDEINKIEP